jgi:hypothetical protein
MRGAGSIAAAWLNVHPGISLSFEHLAELVGKARQVNDRLLTIERAGQVALAGSLCLVAHAVTGFTTRAFAATSPPRRRRAHRG